MQLSNNFTLDELTKSITAIREGIDNTPNAEQIDNLRYLAQTVLQPARDEVGYINVDSGFRSAKLNSHKSIKGAKNSKHLFGEAADLDSKDNAKNRLIFDFIASNCVFDQLIWEFGTDDQPDWVHVSVTRNGKNRMQKLQSVKRNGKTVYLPY